MATKIKAKRSVITGNIPPTTVAADIGELGVNLTDRKLYVRDGAGVSQLIAQGIANYSAALIYALGDLAIQTNQLYLCTTAVPVPEPFDPANWTLLSGGGSADGAVILAPATAGRNRIVPAAAAAEGILIDAPSTQTADLLAIPGTALSDTGVWAVDSLGFSNQRVGAVVWRQAEPTHNFVARGQPAAFDGARWVPAEADVATGTALAVVQEIIDANTLVLRAGGRITNLQTAAFAGGVITPATAYYVSATVAGQLTPVEPTTGRRDPVLTTISATAGVVTTGSSRNLVEAPPPTHVGPTAPTDPELGDLWYRTVSPIGLLVYRDDISIGEWVPATLPEVSIGDAAPSAPLAGHLWYKTSDPVGLFIRYTDVDSSQWVQVGGGGVPPFASTAEAKAGVVTDKVMSPALVQARGGDQNFVLAGLTTVTFNNVPNEANEIDLLLNGVGIPASALMYLDWSGAPAARAFSGRIIMGTAYTAPTGDDNNVRYILDNPGNAQAYAGGVHLVRDRIGGAWYISGSLRRATNSMIAYSGVFNMIGEVNAFLRLTTSLAFTDGGANVRWRI